MDKIHWAVDSLVSRDKALFGFGWIFSENAELVSTRLVLKSADGLEIGSILAEGGKGREDVARAFFDHPNALNSGYLVLGAFPQQPALSDTINLECTFASGAIVVRAIPHQNVLRFEAERTGSHNQLVLHQLSLLLKRGMRLVRTREFGTLIEKIKKYMMGRPTANLSSPSDLAKVLKRKERKDVHLIIDHDLGGGANHYRDRLVDSLVSEGKTAITLTFHLATLSHMLIVQNTRINQKYAIPGEQYVLDAMRHLSVAEIVYNTAVSFTNPEEIPQLLLNLKAQSHARLKVLVHDFFAVCPSHFLLDHKGQFCNVPDISVCASCLPNNSQGFAALFGAGDIRVWRAAWGGLFGAADEIVAFSNNSAQLLMKAYPQIHPQQISIKPHYVKHLSANSVQIEETQSLCIGVVGQIGYHKGSAFIRDLAKEIKHRGSGQRIVVIGAIDVRCDPSVVSQTGLYNHADMPAKIGGSGANIMLFPSICAETFSYVVQELMYLQLPVAAFNFGAPAERLASYQKGLVLPSMDPAVVLDQLIIFHKKIYLEH